MIIADSKKRVVVSVEMPVTRAEEMAVTYAKCLLQYNCCKMHIISPCGFPMHKIIKSLGKTEESFITYS